LGLLVKLFRAVLAMLLVISPAGMTFAGSLYTVPKYAAILINAETGEVLYARQADATRYPASITKVMTLYVAFEEMAAGRLHDDDLITISANAARQPPSKLGLRPGATISVRDAMGVMVTRSANDIAMALAEHIGGSQTAFADRMNMTAQRLGMTHSWFRNPSGLPDPAHVSTARDIALLSRALVRDFPDRYRLFSTVAYEYRGQAVRNHNHLLDTVPGVDGIKTGFTQMAGFTLAASAQQNGVRLIAVVLGGPNRWARDNNVGDLLQAGFTVLAERQRGVLTTVAANFAEPDDLNDSVIERLTDEEPVLGGVAVSAAPAATHASFASNGSPLKQ
jgi:D-alanyl-D-alanine carboxypeptidase (penicillin-binding protein 5/6)